MIVCQVNDHIEEIEKILHSVSESTLRMNNVQSDSETSVHNE